MNARTAQIQRTVVCAHPDEIGSRYTIQRKTDRRIEWKYRMSILGDDAKITVRTKADLVRERIEEAIMSGRLKAGEKVVVDSIVRETGVSKIPVREALSSLASAGTLVQIPNSGFHVAPLSLSDIQGVYLLRREVEGLVAQLAAPLVDDDTLAQLAELNLRMREIIDQGHTNGLSELNRAFHVAIAGVTGYQAITDISDELLRKVHLYRTVVARSVADWTESIAEHEEIIAALASHDPSRSRAVAAEHASHQLALETRAELS
jgi:DNA-binding GntR family transcriptional regulator